METVQWIGLVITFLTGCGIPVLIYGLTKAGADRQAKFSEMHNRLDHFDHCLDDLRSTVLGTSVRREDFVILKADMVESLNRMRAAISVDTNGLHQRIMRLEDKVYGAKDGD